MRRWGTARVASRDQVELLVLLALRPGATDGRGVIDRLREVLTTCDPGARVPGCPDWDDTKLPAHEVQAKDYGCATAMKLWPRCARQCRWTGIL